MSSRDKDTDVDIDIKCDVSSEREDYFCDAFLRFSEVDILQITNILS